MCRLMLNHGKHVVCEKPLTLHLKDTVELFDLAKKKGRLLMEVGAENLCLLTANKCGYQRVRVHRKAPSTA